MCPERVSTCRSASCLYAQLMVRTALSLGLACHRDSRLAWSVSSWLTARSQNKTLCCCVYRVSCECLWWFLAWFLACVEAGYGVGGRCVCVGVCVLVCVGLCVVYVVVFVCVVWSLRSYSSVESWLYIYLNTTYTFSAMAKILHSFPADFLSDYSL